MLRHYGEAFHYFVNRFMNPCIVESFLSDSVYNFELKIAVAAWPASRVNNSKSTLAELFLLLKQLVNGDDAEDVVLNLQRDTNNRVLQ